MKPKKYSAVELKEILNKYQHGHASIAEIKAIEEWYSSFDQHSLEVFVDDAARDKIHAGISSFLSNKLKENNNTLPRVITWKFPALVAATLAGVVLSLFLYRDHSKGVAPSTVQIIQTGIGEKKEVRLPDNSVIELNQQSKLSVSADFNQRSRSVVLEGEAFFQVAKNARKPFVIISGLLKTKVLGTSFNIKAYPGSRQIKVAVESGKVKIASHTGKQNNRPLAGGLVHNQTLTYDLLTSAFQIKHETASLSSSWRRGELYIDNYTIPEIGVELQRFYNLPVEVYGKTDTKAHFTMKLGFGALQQNLRTLSSLTKTEFHLVNHKIIIGQ